MGRRSVILAALFALLAASCSWTQFGGNAARTGTNASETDLTPANVDSLVLGWRSLSQLMNGAVMSSKFVYRADGYLEAYSTDGSGTCVGVPLTCESTWFADFGPSSGPPVLADGRVFVAQARNGVWRLAAFDENGEPDSTCPPTLSGCQPLWTATWGNPPPFTGVHPVLTVADGLVYAAVGRSDTSAPAAVWAFDAAGQNGCTFGSCAPLFRADGQGSTPPLPTVAGGRLFVPDVDGVRVYDADGVEGCSGGVCAPLYELATFTGTPVSVADGVAYVAGITNVKAFDATGVEGCSGQPLVCHPLWVAGLDGTAGGQPPVVANGRVYVVEYQSAEGTGIEVYDANGVEGCSGSPVVCEPLWRVSQAQMPSDLSVASANASVLFVAGTTFSPSGAPTSELRTFDLAGSLRCNGAPRTCAALSSHPLAPRWSVEPPAVAFGRVVIAGTAAPIEVFALPQQP